MLISTNMDRDAIHDSISHPSIESQVMIDACELCGRPSQALTKHHLIPRAVHTKKRFVNRFGKKEMRERGIMICKLCHSGLHDLFPDEKVLADKFYTRELLLADEGVKRHIVWVRKQRCSAGQP